MIGNQEKFEFSNLDPNQQNISKITRVDIPVGTLKLAANRCYEEITRQINTGIKNSTFSSYLKLDDVSSCFINGESTRKQNSRPLGVLSCLSKIYERVI